jgi:hypothetical protein
VARSHVSAQRYAVTEAPVQVGLRNTGLCVAVDTNDSQGVWWWEPGASGCSTRSTGPGVFKGENASVSPSTDSGATDILFRLQLITGPDSTAPSFLDVRLVLKGSHMRVVATGTEVPTVRRTNLDVPERVR